MGINDFQSQVAAQVNVLGCLWLVLTARISHGVNLLDPCSRELAC